MSDTRRVLVIDDSAVARQVLTNILSEDDSLEVVGTAPDAMIGLRKIRQLSPDVITLDIEMPGMDGLTFLEKLMKSTPLPVVMVSAYTEAGSETALRSFELGAVDDVEKPRYEVRQGLTAASELIIEKVKAASQARVDTPATRFFREDALRPVTVSREQRSKIEASSDQRLIAIGASTGGPQALLRILRTLPREMPPILLVQHITPSFTQSFAKSLDDSCQMKVAVAVDGIKPIEGHIYVAPGDRHMLLARENTDYRIRLSDHDRVNRHRPSVDELFRSVANHAGQNATGVLLTGMGIDGAAGMAQMRQNGGWTIAQDEASSVVFGMPRAAIENGAAARVISLDHIPGELVNYFVTKSGVNQRDARKESA